MKLKWDLWFRAAKWIGTGLTAIALAWIACAQSIGTTTVHGTVYLANGTPGSGSLQLSWPAFTTADNHAVTAGHTTVTIGQDGNISVNLAPNQGSTPAGLYYTAVYHMNDGTTSTEYWVVPSGGQVSIAQVRAQVMPAAQAVKAVSKAYVDQAVQSINQGTLMSTGGTMTGPLGFSGLQTVISTRDNLPIKEVNPLDYGAVSDAQEVADGAMTSGSKNLSSASNPWSVCPVGKTITVQYGGGTNGDNAPLISTVASCTDAGHIVLNEAAQQNASAAGVMWGTDNYPAFAAFMSALPGKRGQISCNGGSGFLISLAGSTRTLFLGSNEHITMDKGCWLYEAGMSFHDSGDPRGMFTVPAGTTNVTINGLNVTGEWQNHASYAHPSGGVYIQGTVIVAFDTHAGPPSSHIHILNPDFENIMGAGVTEFNTGDTDFQVLNGTIINTGSTALNVNSDNSVLDSNLIIEPTNGMGGSAIEAAGSKSRYTNNTSYYSGSNGTEPGSFAMAFGGGNTSLGIEVGGNRIFSPFSTGECVAIADGTTYANIHHNFCSTSMTQNGITATMQSWLSCCNTFDSNVMQNTGTPGASGSGLFISTSKNTLTGNSSSGFGYGVTLTGSTGTTGSGNLWNGTIHDVNWDASATASLHDKAVNATVLIGAGASVSPDTCFSMSAYGTSCYGPVLSKSQSSGSIYLFETDSAGVAAVSGRYPNSGVLFALSSGGMALDTYYGNMLLAVQNTTIHTITPTSDTSTVPLFFPTPPPGTNSTQGATTAFVASAIAAANPVLSGTSASIGGSALSAGNCASGTVTVTGATTSMAVVATPATYPGDAYTWHGYVSATNTVTVKVCTNLAAGGTPAASVYNVRVIQ